MNGLLSVKEAQKRVFKEVSLSESFVLTIDNAIGYVLSKDVFAKVAHPNFDQSAVDGYAVKFSDLTSERTILSLVDEVPAGHSSEREMQSGETARIFTGGSVPNGVDTVVMQEQITNEDGMISFHTAPVKFGHHIRKFGEQINEGERALERGHKLNPASIGMLATIGISEVDVFRLPDVAVVSTGDELVTLDETLSDGKIYESNGFCLQSALKSAGIEASKYHSKDSKEQLRQTVSDLLKENDLLILTGGVSVGDYDYTRDVLEELGFGVIFHKVAQKPGKPLLFTRHKNKFVFGLPGNPRAALMCFYEYVLPFINGCMGNSKPFMTTCFMPLTQDFKKKGDRLHFLIGEIEQKGIKVLTGQGSHMMHSFCHGNAIVLLPAEKSEFKQGELVEVHLLNGYI